ncbi:MAG: PBP1A family penicillin-binding protein [Desulfobacteraceae bacterium]|nr:PBP1A family penicillin-binding protein [Desulfobacteraceae bacterium]
MTALRLMRWFSSGFHLLSVLAGLTTIGLTIIFFVAIKELPQVPEPLSRIIETPPTEIFAANGERVLLLGGREFTPITRVSPNFLQAILATEDHRFYDHHGVDKVRTLKALWITLVQPDRVQGASTITQQVAKNLFFSFEQTFTRKFREMMVALQIESQFSKQEILETYINQIPYGVGVYGIEPAARTYFGKPASDLSLGEAALLAALPKSPTRYNPYRYPERAKSRQIVVLNRMLATAAITTAEHAAAVAEELDFKPRHAGKRTGSYFLDWILKSLEERYGPKVLYHGGLKVTTTLDPLMQNRAETAVREGLTELEETMGPPFGSMVESPEASLQGSLVSIETKTGAVKAMVGGKDYFETEYNRAVESNRLPGSGFKPFLYYTALENLDITPATTIVDMPVTIPVKGSSDWTPRNFDRKYAGRMVLKKGFMKSVNTIAAQLVQQCGPVSVIETARKCGIRSPLQPVYSVALGTSGVSPLEMASAYATFATGGIQQEPFWIRRVEDAYGRVLEEHIISGKRVLDAGTTFQVVDMMKAVVESGTGTMVRKMGFRLAAAGKTGTTNGFRDAWFTGFTPTISTSVWVGFDKAEGLKDKNGVGITGGRGAAPIWTSFMLKATEGEPERVFRMPSELKIETVDPSTGNRVSANAPGALPVILREGRSAKTMLDLIFRQ